MSIKMIAFYLFMMLSVAFSFYQTGKGAGYKTAQAENATAQRDAMATAMDQINLNINSLTAQASDVSHQLYEQFATQAQLNNQSTREIKNVLSKTANQRVNCVFDDDVLRQLDTAYNKSAQAVTSRASSSMPAASSP